MYLLERTQKIKIVIALLSVVSFILSIVGFLGGGAEFFKHGFMNNPFFVMIMVTFFAVGIVFTILCLTVNAIQKDIAEQLKYLDTKAHK